MTSNVSLVIEWKDANCKEINSDLSHAVHAFGTELGGAYAQLPANIASRPEKVSFDLTVRIRLST